MTTAVPTLVHWRDARHDWLLVVDTVARELVVYDANDGRPLRRVGVASGTGAIDAIAGEGNRVIASNRQGSRLQVFSLPALQPVIRVAR